MFSRPLRPRSPRRGVTLVEMLVTVALLVLMMAVITQVFVAATGAVSAAKVYQDLDSSLRQLDSMLRTDLANVTARFTPPLNPKDHLGYFEYGENSFADLQGEDADDYVRFTTKAPEGQFFTGRVYVPPAPPLATSTMSAAQLKAYANSQPTTIQSQYAEVIYFLRNGNLYRRVLLVVPERQSSIIQTNSTFAVGAFGAGNGNLVSWQGVNDVSARPNPYGNASIGNSNLIPPVLLNNLGDLSNRENRWAYSRFSPDFVNNVSGAATPDGLPDDENLDGIPDFYPTLYYNLVNPSNTPVYYQNPITNNNLVNEIKSWPVGNPRSSIVAEGMAFPYTFPGAYSRPDTSGGVFANGLGWIHTPDPTLVLTTLAHLQALNHSPLDIGDGLPTPGGTQTWWGFPTWRETLSPNWVDPTVPIQTQTVVGQQPTGLSPFSANASPTSTALTALPLPPMDGSYVFSGTTTTTTPVRVAPQLYNDGAGSMTFAALPTGVSATPDLLWGQAWEDDLIATGVRSFDVKAYDNTFSGYVDLGWGDDLRVVGGTTLSYLTSTPATTTWPIGSTNVVGTYAQTYAHEGRIPPLSADGRPDAQWPQFSPNIGDDTASIVRLRRVWDSWSTDYTNAPSNGVDPSSGLPFGPPFSLPAYPSYPPPYPMPLRGIQIQIRMVDPRNERVKVLTIRQDFSDKL